MKRFAGSLVARPVDLVLKPGATGIVRGSGSMAAYIEVGGIVIAITGRTVPAMPNGISVVQQHGLQALQTGESVEFDPDVIRCAGASVRMVQARSWDPRIPQRVDAGEELPATGRRIWRRLGFARTDDPVAMVERLARSGCATASEPDGRAGLEFLLRSVAECDPKHARRAGELLIGRGPGLTPEGDDFLAAVLATVYACEPWLIWRPGDLSAWRSAVVPAELLGRTTLLSSTLLVFAERGWVSEPVQTLFDPEVPSEEWDRSLSRLRAIGHGTGRAWAAGCAATAVLLTR